MENYDAIVIGTGQAGPALAVRLGRAGMRTAIIERNRLGGTCVNTGCIPTKALVASARAAHMARRAADYGVVLASEPRVDMKAVKARKDAIVRQSRDGVASWLGGAQGVTLVQGHARFEDASTVRVGDKLLAAPKFFVNVGGRPAVPPIPGLDGLPCLTSTSMMDVDFLPEHLIVVGGSYIGLEFAQMYRRFGSRVTVLEMADRLIPREDDDICEEVRAILEREEIDVRLGVRDVAFRRDGEAVVAAWDGNPGGAEVAGSHVLLAIGRRPNTDDLGLDRAGVATDARGFITVDDELRTSVPGIWALGDVNGRGAFTHTAWNDYEIVAANLLDGESRRVSERIPAYALFIDPPLGRAGMTEREVRATGRAALVGRMRMARVGRARERGETQGFMKVLVDARTERILGACLLGIECDEIVHSLLDVMYAGAPCTVVQRAMHIHPTVTELIPTLLAELKPLQ